MTSLTRNLRPFIENDLSRKMVFVGGPRQVGKTQLGKMIVQDTAAYLNYDVAAHRNAILKGELPPTEAWFFDEIHKTDTAGDAVEPRYFSDIDGREVDFGLVRGSRPVGFVECKWDDAEISPALRYLRQRFPEVQAWQVSAVGKKDYETLDSIRVAPAEKLLNQLV